jgi:hypothetical protein
VRQVARQTREPDRGKIELRGDRLEGGADSFRPEKDLRIETERDRVASAKGNVRVCIQLARNEARLRVGRAGSAVIRENEIAQMHFRPPLERVEAAEDRQARGENTGDGGLSEKRARNFG